MTSEELLVAVEDLFRTMPDRGTLRHETHENTRWFGRAAALVSAWDKPQSPNFILYHTTAMGLDARAANIGMRQLLVLLERMRADLTMKTGGPQSVMVAQGMTFHYFDHLRKIIETARDDVLFVDAYLNADFVSTYLPSVPPNVPIRLLTSEYLPNLLPAVRMFAQQSNAAIEVRSPPAKLHDRWLFIDRKTCHQSGASFKDGGRTAPTTITEVVDAFAVVQQVYEGAWQAGTQKV